jgi:hypothetical protein
MTEENIEEKESAQKRLASALEKGTDEEILSLLIELKEYGNLFYLNTILNLVTGNRSEILKKTLVEFISDIKFQDAAPIIADFISENIESSDIIRLVTASWQSRLDFSRVLSPYFEILIKGDYKTAFEAFTVIENSIDSLSIDELSGYIDLVKKGIVKADRDKQLLLLEMVSVLDKTRRAAQ